jgi:hypothetical protein
VSDINAYKANQSALDIWVGEAHDTPQGKYLVINLAAEIEFQNFILENSHKLKKYLLLDPQPTRQNQVSRMFYEYRKRSHVYLLHFWVL